MSVSQSTLKKAQQIVDSGGVAVITEGQNWRVRGTRDTYSVTREGEGFLCEKLDQDDMRSRKLCVGWQFHGGEKVDRTCKHIEAVRIAWLNHDAHVKAYYKQKAKGGD